MSALKFMIKLTFGLIVLFFAAFLIFGDKDERPLADRIAASCQREYGYNEYEVNQCKIRLMSKYLQDNSEKRLDRAGRGAGL
jgi:hypothetical protein